jgi:hypothetical protein
MKPNDTKSDAHASTLKATADLYQRSAAETDDSEKRERLLEYANIFRAMALMSSLREAEADAEARVEADARADDDNDADWLWKRR